MLSGFSHSVLGASHKKRNIVCQDSSGFKIHDDFAIAVVADGHGGKKYFRSNIGSKFAVESAIEAVEYFCSDFELFSKCFVSDHDRIMKHVEKYVIMLWNQKITEHLNKCPVGEKEISHLTYDEFKDIPPESYYGTTLICSVMTDHYMWGFQIGDGSVIGVFEDGDTSMLIDYNESNPANITYSMCNHNAFDMFDDYYIENKRPVAVFVSTDGLYTSFGSDRDFLDYHVIVAGELINSDSCFDSLKANMEKRSHYGTEDDISISCIYDKDLTHKKLDILKYRINTNKKLAEDRKAKLLKGQVK